jgi:hypothetical protein
MLGVTRLQQGNHRSLLVLVPCINPKKPIEYQQHSIQTSSAAKKILCFKEKGYLKTLSAPILPISIFLLEISPSKLSQTKNKRQMR